MDIPDKIYLQIWDEDGERSHWPTWCVDNIYDTDVLYVRAVNPLDDARIEALRELWREANDVVRRMGKAIRK